MAFALVNPVSALWQRRGLTTLLMPEGYDAFAAPQQEASRAASANSHGQARTGQHARERQPWQQSGQQQSPRPASPAPSREVPPQRRPHMPAGPDTANAASRTAPQGEAAPAAEQSIKINTSMPISAQ